MAEAVAAQMACPGCGASLPILPAWVTWCQGCDWNVDPSPPPKQSWWDRQFSQASARTSQSLFVKLSEAGADKPPRNSIALNAVAVAVHLLTVVTFAAGVLILAGASGFVLPIRIILGFLAVMAAFLVQPFWHRRKKPTSKLLERDQTPALYGLVDQVATALGCRGLDGIRLDLRFNASIGRTRSEGWVMTIGLPLWTTLSAQQRVALIGHELGHQVNRDQRRKLLVWGAAVSMAQWSYLLNPRGGNVRYRGLAALGELLAIALMLPLSASAAGLAWLLNVLGSRQGLAAEYYADALAATVAGTDAAASGLERLLLAESCFRRLEHTAKFDKEADPWAELAGYAAAIPAQEIERQRRLGRLRLPAVDSTHPPTQLRADLVRKLPYRTAAVVMDAGQRAAIDAELAGPLRGATALLHKQYPR